MNMNTRFVLRALLACVTSSLVLIAQSPALAQTETYPAHPVQLIIPGTVGGGTYVLARMVAEKYQQITGQPAVVITLPGASGTLGVQKVTTSKPDGYTALFGFNQLVTMNPNLLSKLPYDVEKDLQPVTLLAESAYVWLANSAFPANTVAEWVALAKAEPERITFATSGAGSAANLGAELFMQMTNTKMLHVPYKGDPTTDLLAGFVQLRMEPYATALSLLKGGRVKALAVTGPGRLPSLPDVPTMGEILPGYVLQVTYSVWLPSATPKAVAEKLQADLAKIARMPDVAERMAALSVRAIGSTPAELQEATRRETQMWSQLIKARGIKVDP
jgi:tripartite-type tricarboxylate transporter receptor subunit TctC